MKSLVERRNLLSCAITSSGDGPIILRREPVFFSRVQGTPYHLQAIKASVEEAIAICGQQLFFFYAWQQQPGLRQLPGHGPTDFKPWLEALAKINYRWYVNPFMHGHVEPDIMAAALIKSRDYLRGLV